MILRFTVNLDVSFTNNTAELPARSVKVQQRTSGGCWRTLQGLIDFAVVQSYLSTATKWGIVNVPILGLADGYENVNSAITSRWPDVIATWMVAK
jgi:transposase